MHIEFKVVFQQYRVRGSAWGPVRFMPSPGELETNNTCVCPDINNAGESPFLKPSECPDQIPSAEQNLNFFFFIYTHTEDYLSSQPQLFWTSFFGIKSYIYPTVSLSKSSLFACFTTQNNSCQIYSTFCYYWHAIGFFFFFFFPTGSFSFL